MKKKETYVSVVLPVRNEEKNLEELHKRILNVFKALNHKYEVIYVENGSTDGTLNVLKSLKGAKVLVLRWQPYMRSAQSLAMDAGFKYARGRFVIYMDSDLQVDPEEMPKFIEKLEDGYDVVCGWRQKRTESKKLDILFPLKFLLRTVFNIFRRALIDEKVHDPGSAIKGFTKEALEEVDLYGEMHRFIVAILYWKGFRICEIPVSHHPRVYGSSKYNIFKGVRGFADLLNVFFWRKYADRPLHFFGVFGLIVSSVGFLFLSILLGLRFFHMISLSTSIFPVLAVLMIIVGVQLFVSGMMADVLQKNSKRKEYSVREIIEK